MRKQPKRHHVTFSASWPFSTNPRPQRAGNIQLYFLLGKVSNSFGQNLEYETSPGVDELLTFALYGPLLNIAFTLVGTSTCPYFRWNSLKIILKVLSQRFQSEFGNCNSKRELCNGDTWLLENFSNKVFFGPDDLVCAPMIQLI